MTAPVLLDRDLLAKVLGQFGSDRDPVVVVAARTADRMVRAAGLTWQDVVLQHQLPAPPPDPVSFGDAREINYCLRWAHRLNEWEANFIASISRQDRPLSTRQRNKLACIVDKLRAKAEAA